MITYTQSALPAPTERPTAYRSFLKRDLIAHADTVLIKGKWLEQANGLMTIVAPFQEDEMVGLSYGLCKAFRLLETP